MGVAHVRVELFGQLVSGAEAWSMGFSTAPPGGGALIDATDWAEKARDDFESECWTAPGMQDIIPTSVAFVGARVHQLNAAGATIAVGQAVLADPDFGIASSAQPPQCSVVVSLRTPVPGPRGRGRMYFPVLGTGIATSTGRMSTASRDLLATSMVSFFDAWNAEAGIFPVGVASDVGEFVTTVDRIQVGTIIDTQRRRRDALPEAYVSLALAP